MKKKIEPYYVLSWDFNHKNVEYYNIMTYLVDVFEEERQRKFRVFHPNGEPKTFEEFKEFILHSCRYQFWSRCEYEIVVSGFPPQDKDVKIDIYDQIEHNIDVITKHFMSQICNDGI